MRFQRKDIPGLNSTSMADIAFLLLIFFLVTSSMDPTTGLYRQLTNASPENILKKNIEIQDRNLMNIRIGESNQLFLNEEKMSLSLLRASTKVFIDNPENQDYLPEKKILKIEPIGEYPVTNQHIIQLEVDRRSNYQTYISTLSELTAAYNELREEFAERHFLKPFFRLSEEEKNAIREIYPQRISEKEIEKGGNP